MNQAKTNNTKFLIVQVIPKTSKEDEIKTELYETEQLIATFGGRVIKKMVQRLRK